MKRNYLILRFHFGVLCLIVTLTACGGGSQNGGNKALALTNPVEITSLNARRTLKHALSAYSFINSLGPNSGSVAIIPVSSAKINFSSHSVLSTVNKIAENNNVETKAVIACSGGGSKVIPDAGTIANSYTTTYNNCIEGRITTNGSDTFTISSGDPQSNDFDVTIIIDISHVDSNDNSEVATSGAVHLVSSDNIGVKSDDISGAFYSYLESTVVDKYAVTLREFNFLSSTDSNLSIKTTSNNFILSSTDISGTIVVKTTLSFETRLAEINPFIGKLLVTGAAGSKLLASVNATATGLTMQVDPNGNGYDSALTEEIPWSAL